MLSFVKTTKFFGTSRNGRSLSVRGSFGIPSSRSAMIFYCISSVPSAIDRAGTDTRISAICLFTVPSSPVPRLGPSGWLAADTTCKAP
jgi:hypothetical protein